MLKIAVHFLAGCVFFGLMKSVTSELIPHGENDLATSEDIGDENQNRDNRIGTNIGYYRPGQNNQNNVPMNVPTPRPVEINLVECYVCTNCPKVLPNTTSKLCPYTIDITKQGCVVYAEKYRHMNKPWYIRGCASERGSCADIKKAHDEHADIVKLLFCAECHGDRCNTNSAPHSVSDFTMAFFAMVVTTVIAKYTLS